MRWKRWIIVIALLVAASCSGKDAGKQDLGAPRQQGDAVPKDFATKAPDKVVVYNNLQSFPNIVQICIDGVAFRAVSDHYVGLATPAVDRVPEWDKTCPPPTTSTTAK